MSILGLILVAQAAAPIAAAAPPDVELRARAEIRSLEIRSQRPARLTLHAEPGLTPPVAVERSAPAGKAKYRNLTIAIRGIAHLAAPKPIAAIDITTGESK